MSFVQFQCGMATYPYNQLLDRCEDILSKLGYTRNISSGFWINGKFSVRFTWDDVRFEAIVAPTQSDKPFVSFPPSNASVYKFFYEFLFAVGTLVEFRLDDGTYLNDHFVSPYATRKQILESISTRLGHDNFHKVASKFPLSSITASLKTISFPKRSPNAMTPCAREQELWTFTMANQPIDVARVEELMQLLLPDDKTTKRLEHSSPLLYDALHQEYRGASLILYFAWNSPGWKALFTDEAYLANKPEFDDDKDQGDYRGVPISVRSYTITEERVARHMLPGDPDVKNLRQAIHSYCEKHLKTRISRIRDRSPQRQ